MVKSPDFILGAKAIVINGSILGAVQTVSLPTLAQAELFLKCVLLTVTIAFTIFQWVRAAKKSKAEKTNE